MKRNPLRDPDYNTWTGEEQLAEGAIPGTFDPDAVEATTEASGGAAEIIPPGSGEALSDEDRATLEALASGSGSGEGSGEGGDENPEPPSRDAADYHQGGGMYLIGGERIRGKAKAQAALDAILGPAE